MSTVTQRQSIHYSGSPQLLAHILQQTAGEVETVAAESEHKRIIRAFGCVDIILETRLVTLEWIASPCNDMFADAVLSAILQVILKYFLKFVKIFFSNLFIYFSSIYKTNKIRCYQAS